ncbi:response regulator [Zoogloea sp.]|uniref:response regulator n=1 Tax=Zoogloea sp. TaxID=49181 RepID=UPI002634FB1A|nr:response regulator [Zoogloea sp.]MDD3353064.1 response regulator [Zoogloea sp.]
MAYNAHGAAEEDVQLTGRILVVDDDAVTRGLHRAVLAQQFDVLTAESGEEALELCAAQLPDLVVLDVHMPGLNGFETCRRLRQFTSIPILFVTATQSFEENLEAFDAGGNDLILKPIKRSLFLRKVAVAIRHHRALLSLAEEKKALEKMAMGFLSSASQTGVLLNFMRGSVICEDYQGVAEQLLKATQDLGLQCSVLIHHPEGATAVTDRGEPSPLERSILEHASEMGRIFQFKQRLVVNYDRVSVIVANMPDETEEPERAGILRDSLAILAETTEALVENVDARQEGRKRAELLQIALSEAESALGSLAEKNRTMLMDTRLLLQELVDSIEKSYAWLNTTQTQEAAISATMDSAIQRILVCLARGGDFDTHFAQVLHALNAGRSQNTVELF